MAGVTQTIPNYIQGISAQPDELKKPGQVQDMLNAIPDVARGLIKRPGSKLIGPIGKNGDGIWFSINRSKSEQYIGQVKSDGTVNIWSCTDGASIPVWYSSSPPDVNLGQVDGLQPGLKPLPIPSDWVDPTPPSGSSPPTSGSEVPQDPGTNPYPNCDLTVYNASLVAYRECVNQINKLQIQIEQQRVVLNTENDRKNNPTNYVQYDKVRAYQYGEYYIVYQGSVDNVSESPFLDKNDWSIGKPSGATRGQKKTGKVMCTTRARYDTWLNQNVGIEDDEEELEYIDGIIYAWAVANYSQGVINTANSNIASYTSQLNTQKAKLSTVREAYEVQAVACGVFSDPFAFSALRENDEATTYPQLQYFKYQDVDDLQFLTINDYTFVNNRNIRCSVSNNDTSLRPYEAIVELKNLEYVREYSLYFNTTADASASTQIESVKRLTVNKTDWDGGDDTCPFQGTENFTVEKGTGAGLSFQLKTLCQQVRIDPNDAYSEYKSEYTTSVRLLAGGSGWKTGDEVEVTMEGATYTVRVAETGIKEVFGDLGVALYNTPVDGETVVNNSDVLAGIKAAIDANTFGWITRIIGNSIHIQAPQAFQITTDSADLLNVFTSSVNDVSRLPEYCVDGYVVKVTNSAELEDDYYLKFVGEGGVSGSGVWEETYKPGIEVDYNPYSMPHQIVRLFDENGNIYFRVSPVDWEPRLVGDEVTNPTPSFVGKAINKVLLYRNRLVMLSDQNIIMSRPGDFFNFWAKTALAVVPIDPIDISTSSINPATLFDGVEVNAGLLVLGPEEQFLVTTDNDVFSAETAKILTVSRYGYNVNTAPVSMGTTVGFVNNAGLNSRLFEMTNIRREGDAEVLDQSKVIDNRLPNNIDILAHSKTNNLILLGNRGQDIVYGYQYFNSGQKRIQSAWFKWDLTGDLVHYFINNDKLFLVLDNKDESGESIISLQMIDLKYSKDTALQSSDGILPLTVHLDNWKLITPDNFTFDELDGRLGSSTFSFPLGYFSSKDIVAWAVEGDNYQGSIALPEVTSTVDANGITQFTGKLPGDYTKTRIIIGYQFKYSIELPKIYPTTQQGEATRSDIRSSLNIHRLKLSFGPIGVYDVELKKFGKGTSVQTFERREMDDYAANTPAIDFYGFDTIPVYERNTSLSITIQSEHPSPATLYSMTWEGDYNNKFYRRV